MTQMTQNDALRRIVELLDEKQRPTMADFEDMPSMADAAFARSLGATQVRPDLMEDDDTIVCTLCDDEHPLICLDNEVADCAECGRRVQFRPAVVGIKGKKLCPMCALAEMEAEGV